MTGIILRVGGAIVGALLVLGASQDFARVAQAQTPKAKSQPVEPAAPPSTPAAPPAQVPAPMPGQKVDIGAAEPFSFFVMGDIPYRIPQDMPKFERLIAAANALKPAFSVHVGDIKSSSEPCTDEYFKSILVRFQRLEHPLVYTPGDNEWTDCHRERAGRFDPRERLSKIRELFYARPSESLGKVPMPVESQAISMPTFAAHVENVRFWKNGVLFVTAHVVGSNNGFEATELEAAAEYFQRNKANVTWLDDSFRLAREQGAKGVVVLLHAQLYTTKQKFPAMPFASGHVDTVRALERGARSLGKPLVVIHGDEHEFELTGLVGINYKRIPNAWRVQVMGDNYVHGLKITINPGLPGFLSVEPVVVPENGDF